jgi:putative nucleotidyltransferase with HDIG domain
VRSQHREVGSLVDDRQLPNRQKADDLVRLLSLGEAPASKASGQPISPYHLKVSYDAPLADAPPLDPRVAEAFAQRLEHGSFEVPLLPEVAANVLSETAREDWSASSVVELLKRDPAMAANLLKLSNSVAFRGAAPVVSLQQAVARLGASNVRQLAVVIACETRVFQVPGFEVEVRQTFRHSLAAALAAREIARARRANVEDAFLGGLLHDVGWPLLLQVLLDLSKRLEVKPERRSLLATAKAHHAPVARRLAAQWKLPERLSEAMQDHHREHFDGPHAAMSATLALADALAKVGATDLAAEAVRAHAALAVLNFYPDTVESLLAQAPRWWAEAGAS